MKRVVPQPALAIAIFISLFLASCGAEGPSGSEMAAPNPSGAETEANTASEAFNSATPALPIAPSRQGAEASSDLNSSDLNRSVSTGPSVRDQLGGQPAPSSTVTTPVPDGADMAPDAPRTDVPIPPAPPRTGAVNVEIDARAPVAVPERDTGDEDLGSDDNEIDRARNGAGNLVTLDQAAALACAAAEGALTELDESRSPVGRLTVLHSWAEQSENSAIVDGAELVGSNGNIAEIVGFLTICVDGGYEL